jgi:hypothetical protein
MWSPEKTLPLFFLLSAGALFVEHFLSIYRYCLIGDEGYANLVSIYAANFYSRHDFAIVVDND